MSLAIFDIDKTLVKEQVQLLFLRYARRRQLIGLFPYLRILIWFALYKIGFNISPQSIMEYAFAFLRGWPVERLDKLAQEFFETSVKQELYPEAVGLVGRHRTQGDVILLLTNIIQPLAQPIARHLNAQLIGSQLEVLDGKFSGRLLGSAYGENKLEIAARFTSEHNYDLVSAYYYADHLSDIHLLEKVGHPVVVNPARAMAAEAARRNWPVLKFSP